MNSRQFFLVGLIVISFGSMYIWAMPVFSQVSPSLRVGDLWFPRVYSARDELTQLFLSHQKLGSMVSSCIQFGRPLKVGAVGDDVRNLQTMLNQVGGGAQLDMNGVYGRRTKDAVSHFQAGHSLSISGVVDIPTRLLLLQLSIQSSSTTISDYYDRYPNLWNLVTNSVVSSTPVASAITAVTSSSIISNASTTSSMTTTSLNIITPQKIVKYVTKPVVEFELSNDWGSYTVKKNKRVVGTIPNELVIGQIPDAPTLILQTGSIAYIAGQSGKLFELDLLGDRLLDVTPNRDSSFEDVSPDESMLVWDMQAPGNPHKIIVENTASGSMTYFDVPSKFNQVGNILFSPDNSKVAYVAGSANYGVESAVIFIIDLKTGGQKQVAATKQSNSYFVINQWADKNTVSYSEQTVGEDLLNGP